MMYAIVDYHGEQHKVREGETICLADLNLEKGASVEFENILYFSKDNEPQVGTPYIKNAKVVGEVLGFKKDKKVISFFYRRRKSSSRKKGHRQQYSLVKIDKITI